MVDSWAKYPLIYCMAYVAALYAPHQRHWIVRLLPPVLTVIASRHTIGRQRTDDAWTLLQAFAVLYTWAPAFAQSQNPQTYQLSTPDIKAAVEALALKLSLHLSVIQVAECAQNANSELRSLPELKFYLFWLWIYNNAQRYSLLFRTPPTIREDSTIKQASQLLDTLLEEPNIKHIVIEVDLCSLWNRVGLNLPGLSEWWCPPRSEIDIPAFLGHLDEINQTFEDWGHRWSLVDNSGPFRYGTPSIFNYRFAFLCVNTYAVSALLSPENAQRVSEPTRARFVKKSLDTASLLFETLIRLPPFYVEYLRYLPDGSYLKITIACSYTLRCLALGIVDDATRSKLLNNVRCLGQLIADAATDKTSIAYRCARRIRAQVDDLENISQREESREEPHDVSPSGLQDFMTISTTLEMDMEFDQGLALDLDLFNGFA